MATPQMAMPTWMQLAQPFFLVDANGNPLSLSTVAGNVNINQVNGVAFSSGNPLFAQLVAGSAAIGTLAAGSANVGAFQFATTNAAVPATANNQVVKNTAGYLAVVTVTATGSTNLIFYDNATTNSGTIIGIVPSTATVGQLYTFYMPAANGIVAAKATTTPAVTVGFS